MTMGSQRSVVSGTNEQVSPALSGCAHLSCCPCGGTRPSAEVQHPPRRQVGYTQTQLPKHLFAPL